MKSDDTEAALKKSTEQLQMLYETSKELNKTLNLEDAYKVILEFVSKLMDCEGLIVSRYDRKTQKIYYSYVWIQGARTETGSVPPVDLAPEGKGILSRVIRSGNPLIINDYEAELKKSQTKFRVDEKGRTYDINSERKDNTKSALLVPLKIEGKVIGVLHITSFKKNAYTQEHMRLLESISVHISSTINNATLYRLAIEELTERKRTGEELKKSEERFSLAFKLSPIPISLTRLNDGTFIDINDAFVKLLGYTHKEVKGLKTTDVNIWDVYTRNKTMAALKERGTLKDIELIIRNKKGELLDTLSTLQVIKIGGEDCLLAMILDITERKKAEEQLRKLSRAVDQSSASIIITDLKGNIEYVNPKFSEVSGYSSNEAIGKNTRILKSGKNPEELYSDLWKTISSGRDWHGELQNKRKNGEFYWEWASISPIFDSKGSITNYLAVKEDITINKLIQDQIHLQAILLESITDAVISVDHDYNVKSWNSGAEKMYDWKAQEVVGKNLMNILKTEFVHESPPEVLKYVNKHNTWLGEVLQITKSGKKISILSSISTLRDEKGTITGYVSVNRDITERKLHEEKLKTSLKEKEILLKEIHHRVKNNLQVISSLLKMQTAYIKDPLALDYFKISSQRVKSMALIHEQLYRSADLSKIDFENYIKKLSMHLYQTYGVSSSKVRFIVKVNDIKLEIDTAIPCGLLVNELISNSLKHGFPENKTGKIEVEMERTANKYVLKVRDNGKGFPKNIDFQNTETLGMQLVNTLVEQIEGAVELKNDNGTEFTITFRAHEYKKRI
jgi:PAS domain S-box-containing protein